MPISTTSKRFRKAITPVLVVRESGECRVDIDTDTIRLRATSIEKSVNIDYRLPIESFTTNTELHEETLGTFWLKLDPIEDFLKIATGDNITVTLPTETNNESLVLQSNQLTYQLESLSSSVAHRLLDHSSPDEITKFTIEHGKFDQAVQGANLVAGQISLTFDAETHDITFSAEGDQDAFQYTVDPVKVEYTAMPTSSLTIAIERLREFTSIISPMTLASIGITPHYLAYHAEFPVPGSELNFQVGKRISEKS